MVFGARPSQNLEDQIDTSQELKTTMGIAFDPPSFRLLALAERLSDESDWVCTVMNFLAACRDADLATIRLEFDGSGWFESGMAEGQRGRLEDQGKYRRNCRGNMQTKAYKEVPREACYQLINRLS